MDVYVVSNVWQGGPSLVVGVAADETSARDIAARHGSAVPDWTEWRRLTRVDEPRGVWARARAEVASTGLVLRQEIVQVPLAGHAGQIKPPADTSWVQMDGMRTPFHARGGPDPLVTGEIEESIRMWSGLR